MTLIGIAGEDEAHFQIATTLIDDALLASIDWLRDVLDSCRTWCSRDDRERWYKYRPDDAYDLRPVTINGMTIRPQGRIRGEPLKPEAGMWRNVLLLFCHREPRPDIVVLVRDLDGYPARRDGIDQVCKQLRWPFNIVAATPEPEIEAWLVSGFTPSTHGEHTLLAQVRHALSFDPTLDSHRLTSHPNDAPRDAKRVLAQLCLGDRAREAACLDRGVLHERGALNGARAFLDSIDNDLLPIFGHRD